MKLTIKTKQMKTVNKRFNQAVLMLSFGFLGLGANGQSDSALQALYPYVSFDKNHFTGVENSVSFNRYYQNFDRMMRYGIGQQSIIHFGGSHIQADIWSNLLRERLQNIDTTIQGSRGLVFPFKAAGTNRPYSYSVKETGTWEGHRSSYNKHHSNWGVSGITATTKGIDVSLKFTFHESVTPVQTRNALLFTNITETDYTLHVDVDDTTVVVDVFDLGNGYQRLEFSQMVDSLTLRFTKPMASSSQLEFYGLVLNSGHPGVTYHSVGVNGSRFISFQRCERFQEQLNYLNPDLVILSIGTNDSSEPDYSGEEYKANFKAFLDQVREVNPNCAIMLTVPNDNYVRRKYHNDNLENVRTVIYELAEEYDAKVWDLYGIMGGAGSAKTWMNAGMMKSDLVHFTKEGYLLKGDLFYRAFLEDYLKWYSEQEPIWTE